MPFEQHGKLGFEQGDCMKAFVDLGRLIVWVYLHGLWLVLARIN
jgi:hypothetical protein